MKRVIFRHYIWSFFEVLILTVTKKFRTLQIFESLTLWPQYKKGIFTSLQKIEDYMKEQKAPTKAKCVVTLTPNSNAFHEFTCDDLWTKSIKYQTRQSHKCSWNNNQITCKNELSEQTSWHCRFKDNMFLQTQSDYRQKFMRHSMTAKYDLNCLKMYNCKSGLTDLLSSYWRGRENYARSICFSMCGCAVSIVFFTLKTCLTHVLHILLAYTL